MFKGLSATYPWSDILCRYNLSQTQINTFYSLFGTHYKSNAPKEQIEKANEWLKRNAELIQTVKKDEMIESSSSESE